jgi:hypothetical protein
MTNLVHRAVSFRGFEGDIVRFDGLTPVDRNVATVGMTSIFQQAFSAAFAAVYEIQLTDPATTLLGAPGIIRLARVYYSAAGQLDELESEGCIIYLAVETELDLNEIHTRSQNFLVEVPDPVVRAGKTLEMFRKAGRGNLADAVRGSFPGLSTWIFPVTASRLNTIASIYAFYHYAWLQLLRVERTLLRMPVRERLDVLSSATRTIVRQRMRLIDIDRLFLTPDRSNIDDYRQACTVLKAKFNLEKRFERLSAMHAAFEKHLENTSSVLRAADSRTFVFTIRLLAGLAIPLSIFATLMDIDLNADVLNRTSTIVTDHRIMILVVVSVLLPLALLSASYVFDRVKRFFLTAKSNRHREDAQ